MKNFGISFVLFFAVWLLLNGSLAWEYLLSGIIVTAILAGWSTLRFPILAGIRITPRSIKAFILFLGIFAFELVKSNFDVARRVLSPALPINPGIVAVKTKLADPVARLLLANAITLTPGTFTIDVAGDTFFIHWIDAGREDAPELSRKIVRKFERHLEVIYG